VHIKNGHIVCVSAYTVKEITNLQSIYAYKIFRWCAKEKTFAHHLTCICVYMYETKTSQPQTTVLLQSCSFLLVVFLDKVLMVAAEEMLMLVANNGIR
jgi:hypothetical protein